MYLGIDVSNHQNHIDWAEVAESGVVNVAVKCTESTNFVDPFYPVNIVGAREHGVFTAAYHFARPSSNTGKREAIYFVNQTRKDYRPDRYILDLEDDRVPASSDLAAYALDFLQTVEDLTGEIPMIYTSRGYAQEHKFHNFEPLARYDLWLASWQRHKPTSFGCWKEWAGWQFTSSGYTPGVGNVDQSLWTEPFSPRPS